MKFPIWLGLALVLLAGHAGAANNATAFVPMVSSGTCATWPTCPAVPNDATHPWYFAQATGQGLALDASIQSLITILNAPLSLPSGAATSALQTTGNGYLSTLATASASQATAANQSTANGSLSTIATNSGTQATAALQTAGNTSAATTATNTGTTATNTGNTATSTASTATNTSTTATNTGTVATNTGAISTATGAQADAAYSGSGNSTIIAALKGIYTKVSAAAASLAGTLSTYVSGFPLVNTVTPFTVTTSSTSVTGLTLPGKVRFQASPVSTLGSATGNTVSIQISYSGGNACTSPNVILGPGQIDDWVYIPGSTAPTACAASAGGILLAVQ